MTRSFDDEPRWDDLVREAILSPEFAEVWEVLMGSGTGSGEAAAHVCHLLYDSEWHLKRLKAQHAEIMEAARKAVKGGVVAQAKVGAVLVSAAASYMVMGVMLGISFACRRLGLVEEVPEETKPVVN